jgi:hypothetical protein
VALSRKGAPSAGSGRGEPELVRRRLQPEEIASGRLRVRIRKGRVEIGTSPDGVARLRWQIRRGAPRIKARADALHISARRVRLILDLPAEVAVDVRLKTGDITSWGAGNPLTLQAAPGRVIGRELSAARVQARADHVSLHFAAPPESVVLRGDSVVLTVPPGPYAIDAPDGAEVTAERAAADAGGSAVGRLVVAGADVQVLAAEPPLPLAERDEAPGSG